ncbi:MAG: hypothetical protein MUE91_05895 [Ignavibacteriaceae bacterium]|jgi:hypothetical protein|nr:hypothetical protein [Ignavibacterium sp.]MCU0413920.1 hypothetical protein [Ignavibacteriaceae bacterium]
MKFINIFLILITINIFSQNWSDTPVPISISVTGYDYSQGDRVELHTNKWGNNLIVLNDGVLGFYRFSVTGNIEYSNPNWLTGVEYANITGDENVIYVVFKKDNVIQAKYSTTGGTFWWSRPNVPGSEGTFLVDAAYSSAYGLFVVWGSAGYIKYYRYKESISAWIEPFTVSNNPSEFNPRVIYKNSQSRVYVTYQKSNISGKYRYCDLSSNPVVWSQIKDGYNRDYSYSAGFAVDDYYI